MAKKMRETEPVEADDVEMDLRDEPAPEEPAVLGDLEKVAPTRRVTPPRALVAEMRNAVEAWPTNIDLKTEAGRCLMVSCMAGGDSEVAGLNGNEWLTTYYACVPGEGINEEDGELHTFTYLCLVSIDGRVLKTTSEVAAHRMARVLEMFGPGPWDPPLRILVTERRSAKSKRTYHDLRLLPRPGV